MMEVKFWGVRGSVPTPLTPGQVHEKVAAAHSAGVNGADLSELPFEDRCTFGGNTTCVTIQCGAQLFILDMGTGIRELGKTQMKQIMSRNDGIGVEAIVLQSHVHWDHIQGFPFYVPIYLDRRKFNSNIEFYGGKQWDSQLDMAYRGQMDAPYFPVNLQELERTGAHMSFNTIYDGWQKIVHRDKVKDSEFALVTARKLFHPQETFGYRIKFGEKSIAFTTDHEPYDSMSTPTGLAELVNRVDLWITDCQYTHDQYVGKGGPQRFGWGHSHERYIAHVAKQAGVKRVITTHHDPDTSDAGIVKLARSVEDLCQVQTEAAFEGMTVNL